MFAVDWSAVRVGVIVGIAILLPATIITSVLLDRDASPSWVVLFQFVTVLGFAAAGWVTGTRRPDTPIFHGAVAGLTTWAIIQGVGIVRRLAVGETINWLALVVAAFYAIAIAVSGAVFADWNRRRRLRR